MHVIADSESEVQAGAEDEDDDTPGRLPSDTVPPVFGEASPANEQSGRGHGV